MGVAVGDDSAALPPLSKAQREHLRSERFTVVPSTEKLPTGVREALRTLFGSDVFAMAEPGAPFQVTDDIVEPRLPVRRLARAGCSPDHCIVYYERGGIAHSWHLVLVRLEKDAARAESGGTAPRDLVELRDMQGALIDGKVQSSSVW